MYNNSCKEVRCFCPLTKMKCVPECAFAIESDDKIIFRDEEGREIRPDYIWSCSIAEKLLGNIE